MTDKFKTDEFDRAEYDKEKLLERALDKAALYKQSSNFFKEEADRILNSYRFRLGSEIIDSLSSPKRLALLPYHILKILREGKNNKTGENSLSPNRLNNESETLVLKKDGFFEAEKSREKRQKRILYVIHDAFGGTVKTNEDLMSYIDGIYEVYVLMGKPGSFKLYKFSKSRLVFLSEYKLETVWNVKNILCEEFGRIYKEILSDLSVDAVHIRHLIYHSFDILKICRDMNIPVIVSFHDFYYICPTINLINSDNVYCGGSCRRCDTKCRLTEEMSPGETDTSKWVNEVWRVKVKKYLNLADKFITMAEYPKKLYCKIYPEFESRFEIIEHGRDFFYDRKYYGSYGNGVKIKILIPGNISFNKGLEYIISLKKCDTENKLEFHVCGRIEKEELTKYAVCHGSYSRDEFDYYVQKIAPDYIGIFSIWPETYCHVLTEAWSCGMPCIVSDIGVLKERAGKNGGCILADLSDPKKTYENIIKISADKKAYDRLCEEALGAKYKSINEMGYEYKKIYDEVLFKRNREM